MPWAVLLITHVDSNIKNKLINLLIFFFYIMTLLLLFYNWPMEQCCISEYLSPFSIIVHPKS